MARPIKRLRLPLKHHCSSIYYLICLERDSEEMMGNEDQTVVHVLFNYINIASKKPVKQ